MAGCTEQSERDSFTRYLLGCLPQGLGLVLVGAVYFGRLDFEGHRMTSVTLKRRMTSNFEVLLLGMLLTCPRRGNPGSVR